MSSFSCLIIWVLLSTTEAYASKPGQGYMFVAPEDSPLLTEDGEGAALRPGYHVTAQEGWMNDPVGMFEYGNNTHILYQWNPSAPVWGAPYWGHVVSSDRVFWKRLPPALVPDTEYDIDGVFSGSAGFQEDGTPIFLYTGVSRYQELGYYYQVQAAAVPQNASDPELVRWLKPVSNPLEFEIPPGGTHAQFRDPITPYLQVPSSDDYQNSRSLQDRRYWTGIGGAVDCVGSAILYSSIDLKTWELEGDLGSQMTVGEAVGSCPAAPMKNPDGTSCQQFGDSCRAWECPDLFSLGDDIYVLKWSDQVNDRNPFASDWYVLSDTEPDLRAATPNSSTGAFVAVVNGTAYMPRVIDFGAVYASKSWQASDGRRLWVGWVFETAVGCYQQCSLGAPFTESMGWQGVHTIPREVTYDEDSATLLFYPIEEVSLLRNDTLYSGTANLTFSPPSVNILPLVNGSSLVQSELLANFSLVPGGAMDAGGFSLGAVLGMNNGTEVTIYLNGSYSGSYVTEANVYIDRYSAGMYTNTSTEGGPLTLPPQGVPVANFELRVLFDHSLFEIFALGGRGRIASRVYPEGMLDPQWSLGLYGASNSKASVNVAATVWELSGCWITDIVKS